MQSFFLLAQPVSGSRRRPMVPFTDSTARQKAFLKGNQPTKTGA
jgi:hypothetical protein